jgi:hypothetical protein
VALGPAQVHAQEHLRPVGGLGSTRTGRDGQDRVVLVVVAREHEGRAESFVLGLQSAELSVQLGRHGGIGALIGQRGQFEQIVGALGYRLPLGDFVAQPFRLAQDLAGGALVGPEVRFCGARVELVDARLLGV